MARHVTRRTLLRTGATVAGALALPRPAGAQSPPGVSTPAVFLDYGQAALNDAYNQDKWAANVTQVRERWAASSRLARVRVGEPVKARYGDTPIETLDVYRTTRSRAPIHIFVHGGAWQRGTAKDSAFAAEMFVRHGAHLVVLDFAWVQDVGGSLNTMADQVKRAIAWTYRNAAGFGGDPDRIYISGHSSGGHLAAVALTSDWTAYGLPRNLLRGGLCCSGLFDLEGPSLSSRREYVRFDAPTVALLSPQRHLAHLTCPITIVYASLDSPEFQRQSRDFAAALTARQLPSQLVVGEHYNHFELIETLANPFGIVGRLALEQMALAAS